MSGIWCFSFRGDSVCISRFATVHSETSAAATCRLGEKRGEKYPVEIFFYSYDLQIETTRVLSTFEDRYDGAFLLPNLDTLDINLDSGKIGEDIQGSILAMVKARYYADNASSIRHLTLRNITRSAIHQYEIEKYVSSLVLIYEVSGRV